MLKAKLSQIDGRNYVKVDAKKTPTLMLILPRIYRLLARSHVILKMRKIL